MYPLLLATLSIKMSDARTVKPVVFLLPRRQRDEFHQRIYT